ncbi:MAG: hypothetical protein U0930_07500 [Pirellulales bacterium]
MSKSPNPAGMRSSWSIPSTWVALFLTAIVVAVGSFVLREFVAKQQVANRLEEIRRSGAPTDDASMESLFTTVANTDNSVAWNELGFLASGWVSTMGHDLPAFGNEVTPATAYTDGTWQSGDRVGELLEQIQPLIQQVHSAADKTNGPVWQPIHFDGFNTLLGPIQEARSISRLLQLDYEYAVFIKDRQRALRDLKSSCAAIRAYQWDMFLVGELVNIAQMGMVYNSVGQSLKSPMWTIEDLNELKSMFDKPIDLNSRWNKLIATERAAALPSLTDIENTASMLAAVRGNNNDFGSSIFVWAAKLPSSQLRLLKDFDEFKVVGKSSLENILHESSKIDQQGSRGILSSLVSPSVTALARVYINMEESRRMLLAAIALKQYKLSHGAFPMNLEELLSDSTLSITRGELEGVDHTLFRTRLYDAQTIVIWNTRSINGYGNSLPSFDAEIPKHDKNSGYPSDGRYGTVISFQ